MPVPVSEVVDIASDHTVTLKYTPVGTVGAEIKYVKVINSDNTFGDTYEVSATPGDGKFIIDAANKKITMPDSVTGKVFVNYEKESNHFIVSVGGGNPYDGGHGERGTCANRRGNGKFI